MKFDIGDIYLRSVKKMQIQLKLAQNIGHCSHGNTFNICGTARFHRRVQDSVMLPCCSEVSQAVARPCCATLCQLPLVSLAVAQPCCATLCQLPLVSLAVARPCCATLCQLPPVSLAVARPCCATSVNCHCNTKNGDC